MVQGTSGDDGLADLLRGYRRDIIDPSVEVDWEGMVVGLEAAAEAVEAGGATCREALPPKRMDVVLKDGKLFYECQHTPQHRKYLSEL